MPPESDSTVVVTPVQGVGEGLSQEGRSGAHNHPADAPLTDDEREALRLWGVSIHGSREDDHRALDALVESILSARLDALHAAITALIDNSRELIDINGIRHDIVGVDVATLRALLSEAGERP